MEHSEPHNTDIHTLFTQLNDKADMVYRFASLYNDYMSEKHDYGTGHLMNMVEIHTLTMIEEHPGITTSQLAQIWHRTKSALSQTTAKLEKRGFITRCKDPNDARNARLYATPTGIEISNAHKAYDVVEVTSTLQELVQMCGTEAVEAFFQVIACYIQLLEDD